MNFKKIITIVLLLFICVSVIALVMGDKDNATSVAVEQTEETTSDNIKLENRLIVYYLHGNVRCQTCEKLEAFSTKAITTNYAGLIENGSIEFVVLNYDDPENEHFLAEFEISFQSLIVVDMKENKNIGYENLAKIWDLTHNEEAYLTYVKEKIDAHVADVL